MSEIKKIKDHPSLVKDDTTRAVIATDDAQLRAYRRRKKQMNEMREMEKRQDSLESEVSDIKDMLSTILRKLDND